MLISGVKRTDDDDDDDEYEHIEQKKLMTDPINKN